MNATHHRCRVHWLRNALAHAPAKQRTAVAAMQKAIFAQETRADAEAQWGVVADAFRVIGILPNDEAIARLVGALMLETNDEWTVARRYMSLETLACVANFTSVRLPPWQRD